MPELPQCARSTIGPGGGSDGMSSSPSSLVLKMRGRPSGGYPWTSPFRRNWRGSRPQQARQDHGPWRGGGGGGACRICPLWRRYRLVLRWGAVLQPSAPGRAVAASSQVNAQPPCFSGNANAPDLSAQLCIIEFPLHSLRHRRPCCFPRYEGRRSLAPP